MTDLRDRLGIVLGDAYILERELGGGGMSRVFLAEERSLGRRVVIKVLPPDLAESLNIERFHREIAVTARLQHPTIVPVLTAGSADGLPFYTMPFVPGLSLRQRMEQSGAMPMRAAVAILRNLAQALAFAHHAGVVHRDIKPENVLLHASTQDATVDDVAVVTDFGIAKAISDARVDMAGPRATALTQVGTIVGTPLYMAPEQAVGEDVDHRADIYSWGVLAYEMLASRPPFANRTPLQLLAAHLSEVPVPLGVHAPALPQAMLALVMQCLEKAPEARPATMRDVLHILEELMNGRPERTGERVPTVSIAVVPFVNLTTDAENEYFSDGISEEILGMLAQDRTLRVAARSSSFAFKGQSIDSRVIAQRLQVSRVLEGSVRRVGNRVRISAQLIDAADGIQLWSGRYDRELTDIFALQDEIATAITATIAATVRGDATQGQATATAPVTEMRTRHQRRPASGAAYDAYLRGLHASHRRADGMHEARADFERALALDPALAVAHAGMAQAFVWLGMYNALPPYEAFPEVRRYAEHALTLDPDLADAHHLLSYVSLWWDRDPGACERHFLRALALEPHHTESLLMSGHFCNVRGRRDEARAATALALQVDPIGISTRLGAVINCYLAGEYVQALTIADALLADVPEFTEGMRFRAMTLVAMGRMAEAEVGLHAALARTNRAPWSLMHLGLVHAMTGRVDDARAVRDELERRSHHEWIPPLAIGHVEQLLGDYDAAFSWYEKALRGRDFLLCMMHVDPSFRLVPPMRPDPITSDPRWTELIRRIGMAP